MFKNNNNGDNDNDWERYQRFNDISLCQSFRFESISDAINKPLGTKVNIMGIIIVKNIFKYVEN